MMNSVKIRAGDQSRTGIMPIHTGRLVLVPQDPFQLLDPVPLIKGLTRAGFLGEPLPGRRHAFATGTDFLQLVSFAGCAVQINLSPDGDGPFCYLTVAGPYAQPCFLSGRNTRPPRCPSCRTPLADWREHLAQWGSGAVQAIACGACGLTSAPWEYDWKESAGFGRLFIEIEEVFPGEAAPTPALTRLLERITGAGWRNFYVQDPPIGIDESSAALL